MGPQTKGNTKPSVPMNPFPGISLAKIPSKIKERKGKANVLKETILIRMSNFCPILILLLSLAIFNIVYLGQNLDRLVLRLSEDCYDSLFLLSYLR